MRDDVVIEHGRTYNEALRKIRDKHGAGFVEMRHYTVKCGGLRGLLGMEEVEVKGYVLDERLVPRYAQSPQPGYPGPRNPRVQVGTPEEEREKILAAAKKDPTLQVLLSEVRGIKEQLEKKGGEAVREHESLSRLEEALALNDFSPAYIRHILNRAKQELTLEELDNYEEAE
jgi:flagellar biosynthesis GTPase FlhF